MNWEKKEAVEVSREELYQQVWATPMQKLAAEYSLSYAGLADICREHHIPRPPAGHWSKKRHGKATCQMELPKLKDQELQTIEMYKRDPLAERDSTPVPPPSYDDDIAMLMGKAKAMSKIKVPERISRYHPLIQAHKETRRKGYDVAYRDRPSTINIKVSATCRLRAYRVLDTLFKTIEGLGGKVEVQRIFDEDVTYVILAGEQAATIRLREMMRRVDHVPANNGRWEDTHKYDYLPTGIFVLEPWPTWRGGVKVKETEKGQPLEERLKDIIIRLIESAQEVRTARRAREAKENKEKDLGAKRINLRQQQEEEYACIEELIGQAQSWDRAARIRAYMQATREKVLRRCDHIDPDSEFDRWFQWGLKQADRLDPLEESPPSILDEQI